jgi:hypothetical protein
MKRIYCVALGLFAGMVVATSAYAAQANWTGRQEQVQTVTGKFVWRCYYNYNGQTFSRLFETSCPSSIEIE